MPRTPGVFGRNPAPVLEIKPESPFVVFYGESAESHETELRGKLILNNPESISVKSVRITLTGTRKVSWHLTNTVSPQPITQKTNFLVQDLNLFPVESSPKNKAHKINAGYHEWDFTFTMPNNLDQSVEGLPTNWVVYNLKASVDRGYMSKQLSATSHIRVIRTLGRDMLESIPMEQINEDIWANKLAYKITVPQKNYIIGTHITADFILIPLRKGVEISTIKMELVESRQLFADYAGRRVSHQTDVQVAVTEGDLPENSTRMVPSSSADDADALFDESHRFSMTLDLPRSLKNCRQSVDTENIRLTHKLRLYVNLKNPEGHTSQLLVKNHVHLFISPNMPPNEDQSVLVDQNILSQQAALDEVNQNAPPTYGLHQLDELYNDIDPSGFMTPGGHHSMMGSGANTPFYAHSRSGSAENLASLNAVAHQSGGGASAVALQHRLQNLDMSNGDRHTRFQPSRQHSSGDSTPAVNGEQAYFDLPSSNYDMDALARTPSYNTAVRTPLVRTPGSVVSMDLPTYEIATSRPGSPNRSRGSRGTTPSPTRSLDTLNEETYRNTQINSRRESPRNSDDGSHTATLIPTRSNTSMSSSESSPHTARTPSPSSTSLSYLSLPNPATRSRSSSRSSELLDILRPEARHRSSSASSTPASSIRGTIDGLSGFRRALRHVG